MAKIKKEGTKKITIQFCIGEDEKVHFINPSCDEIPFGLFCDVMKKVCEVEKVWNARIDKMKDE